MKEIEQGDSEFMSYEFFGALCMQLYMNQFILKR